MPAPRTTDREHSMPDTYDYAHAHERTHEVLDETLGRRFTQLKSDHLEDIRATREAASIALAAAQELAKLHAQAHDREHAMTEQALTKAEESMTQRFASVNEFREQLRDQANQFASNERLDSALERIAASRQDVDRRFAEQAALIVALQTTDAVAGGRQRGQTGVIAAIVASVGFAATVLGLIIVLANVLTGGK